MPPARPATRLLVVDDDSLLRELLSFLLQGTEIHLTTLSSGEHALAYLGEPGGTADAILTDLQMPGTSGVVLAMSLREAAPSALLLGMSARSPTEDESRAFDAFLPKPFDIDGLRDALGIAARNREVQRRQRVDLDPAIKARPLTDVSPASTPETASSTRETQGSLREEPRVLDPGILARLLATIGATQMRQLYEMTASDVESRLERMRQSLAADDHKTVREEAHAIKGGCAMVGATELSQLAAKAELSSETDMNDLREIFEACFRLRRVITIVSP